MTKDLIEEWVYLQGTGEKYLLSNYGRLVNLGTNRELGGSLRNGYITYSIRVDGKIIGIMAHIEVAKHFIPNPENKPIVNHIDENKSNPRADNLEWVTAKENANHGNRNEKIGDSKKLPVCEYGFDGNLVRIWKSPQEVSEFYGIGLRAVQLAASMNGVSKTCYGRQWRYYRDSLGQDIEPLIGRCTNYGPCHQDDMEVPKEYLYEENEKPLIDRYIEMFNSLEEFDGMRKSDIEVIRILRRDVFVNYNKFKEEWATEIQ